MPGLHKFSKTSILESFTQINQSANMSCVDGLPDVLEKY